MLEIEGLTVEFLSQQHTHHSHSNLKVLDRVSLTVQKGEKWGIVGESGSGKSTLALTLMGMTQQSGIITGSVKFHGEELLDKTPDQWEKLRGSVISMVMQQSGEMLTPTLPLLEQVMEPYLKMYPGHKEQARISAGQFLERVGLNPSFFYRYPFTMSGGEVQRALLAMALITEPELLILDEPVSSLDARTKADILDLLEEVTAGCTVLVISHDLQSVTRLADRTAVLYCGAILETGQTKECLQEPAHPYTRALVRAYPTLEGTRELQGIRGEFPPLDQRPGGCPFHPRCTQALEICGRKRPELTGIGTNKQRLLSCHRGGVVELLRCEQVIQRYSLSGRAGRNYLSSTPAGGKDKKKARKEASRYLEAVRGVSLSLREGEVYALVGESGSGKSTLGRILAGVDRPYQGTVFFQGQSLGRMEAKEQKELNRNLQMLFQNSGEALSHRFNVYDLVVEPLQIQKIGDRESQKEAVLRSLEWVNLPTSEHFLHEYPHHLSGGELQRVALARALVMEPKVLVADEPSASLDASVQAKVIKLLLHLQNERGFALFLITHDLALAAKAGDRIGVMQQGCIVEEGPASRVIHDPQHPYTRSLLGWPGQNNSRVFPGKLERQMLLQD